MDAGTLEDILYHIHNWFEREAIPVTGCEIQGGALPASVTSGMVARQWYRIEGSLLNDGLHQHPAADLEDETFDGTVTSLAIPRPLLRVAEEIQDYIDATADARQTALASPYASESFDGYSYTLKGDLTANSGSQGLAGWQAEFASRLSPWRKMY